jgi:hypothetical protein
LNATVTIAGLTTQTILIPDGSPDDTVYDIQLLDYGTHSVVVSLVSYDGGRSHFRLDYVNVNETVPYLPSPPATTTNTTPTTSATAAPPPSRNLPRN